MNGKMRLSFIMICYIDVPFNEGLTLFLYTTVYSFNII
jgi:hypothetical protein